MHPAYNSLSTNTFSNPSPSRINQSHNVTSLCTSLTHYSHLSTCNKPSWTKIMEVPFLYFDLCHGALFVLSWWKKHQQTRQKCNRLTILAEQQRKKSTYKGWKCAVALNHSLCHLFTHCHPIKLNMKHKVMFWHISVPFHHDNLQTGVLMFWPFKFSPSGK